MKKIFLFVLVFLIASGVIIIKPVLVHALRNVETSASISVEPDTAEIGQLVQVNMRIEPAPTPTDVFHGFVVAITRPDGTIGVLGPFASSPNGTTYTLYAPNQAGNYTFQFSFPGQFFANDTIYYMPATSPTAVLNVLPAEPPLPSLLDDEGSWSQKTSMHQARSGLGVAAVNGKIYAIGGSGKGDGGFCAFNEEYDPATDTWTFKAPMLTSRSYFGIAVYQNKIYCIGGHTHGFIAADVNEVYDPATDTWETKVPMPTARLNLQANVVKGKIYLIGGGSNATEVYDPSTDTWTTMEPIPTPVSYHASAVVDNKIYVITSKLNQIYDAENDSWSLGASPPLPAILASAGATTGVFAPERIYVFGADADLPYWQLTLRKFTTQSYDPKTNSWTVCASMPTGRFSASVAVVNDKLYVIGGFTLEFPTDRFTINPSYIFSAVNEQYTPTLDIPKPVDNTAPHITVLSPENKTHESPDITLNFTVNESVSWIGYSLDGQETVTITGNTTIAGLKSGFHNITVYAKDEFENTGTSETIYFTIAQQSESFPSKKPWIVAATAIVVVVGAALVYFIKVKKKTEKAE